VEGSIRHPNAGEAWEYAVTVSITNDRGQEVTRQIVGVGAIQPGEQRKFTVAVEVFSPAGTTDSERGRDASVTPSNVPAPSVPRLK
jgi:hypothetical protein